MGCDAMRVEFGKARVLMESTAKCNENRKRSMAKHAQNTNPFCFYQQSYSTTQPPQKGMLLRLLCISHWCFL